MISVQDGLVSVDFPDGTDPEVIRQAMARARAHHLTKRGQPDGLLDTLSSSSNDEGPNASPPLDRPGDPDYTAPHATARRDMSGLGAGLRAAGAQPAVGHVELPPDPGIAGALAASVRTNLGTLAGGLAETFRDQFQPDPKTAAMLAAEGQRERDRAAGVPPRPVHPVHQPLDDVIPPGLTEEIRQSGEQGRADYLVNHPSGLAAGVPLAADFGVQAGSLVLPGAVGRAAVEATAPLAPVGAAVRGLAGEGASLGARTALGAAAGGVEGAAAGYIQSYGEDEDSRRHAAVLGSLLGTATGGLGAVGQAQAEFRAQDVAERVVQKKAQLQAAGEEAARLRQIPPEQVAPPEDHVAVKEAYLQHRQEMAQAAPQNVPALDATWHPELKRQAELRLDPDLHTLADETEAAAAPKIEAPPRAQELPDVPTDAWLESQGIEPADFPHLDARTQANATRRFRQDSTAGPDTAAPWSPGRQILGNIKRNLGILPDPEAGAVPNPFAKPPRRPSPLDGLVQRDPNPPSGVGVLDRVKAGFSELYLAMVNKEQGPIYLLNRAGLKDQAEFLRLLQGRARSASEIARAPLARGIYRFDPTTGNSTRIDDGFQSIMHGWSPEFHQDVDDYLLATTHLETVKRQADAVAEYEQAKADRAQTIRDLRDSATTMRQLTRDMGVDARRALGEQLRASRGEGRASGQASLRSAQARATERQADLARDAVDQQQGRALGAEAGALHAQADELDARSASLASEQNARDLQNIERWAGQPRTTSGPDEPGPAEVAPIRARAERLSSQQRTELLRRATAAARLTERQRLEAREVARAEQRARRADAATSHARELEQGALERQSAAQGRLDAATPAARSAFQDVLDTANAAAVHAEKAGAARARVAAAERTPDLNLQVRGSHPLTPGELARPDAAELETRRASTERAEQFLQDSAARYGATPDPSRPSGLHVQGLTDVADRFRDLLDKATLGPLQEVGYLSADEVAAMRAKGREYAPLARVIDDVAANPDFGPSRPTGNAANPVTYRSGGLHPDHPVIPPVEAALEQVQRIGAWAERQRVRNLMGDYSEAYPLVAAEVPRVAPGPGGKPAAGTFSAYRNGQRFDYGGSPQLQRAFELLSPRQARGLWKVIDDLGRFGARGLRAGATTFSPEFAARNVIKDQWDAAVMGTKYGYRPFVDWVMGGLTRLAPQGSALHQHWTDFQNQGGGGSVLVSKDRNAGFLTAQDLTGEGGRWGAFQRHIAREPNIFAKVAAPVLFPLEHLSELSEQATRVGAFRRARMKGANELEAADFAREVTVDFSRSGYVGQRWNAYEAFANADLQGMNRFMRAVKEKPVATLARGVAMVTIPSILNWYRWKDDEDYKNLPQWEKEVYYHAAKLGPDDATTKAMEAVGIHYDPSRPFIRVPRPLGLVNLAFSYGVHGLLDYAVKRDPRAVQGLVDAVIDQTPAHFVLRGPDQNLAENAMPEVNPTDLLPSAVQPAVEAATNYSRFRNAPVEPPGFSQGATPGQARLPEDRVSPATSGVARHLGSALGASPIKLDYLAKNYAGGGGTLAVSAVDKALGLNRDKPDLPTHAADVPLLRGFTSSATIGIGSEPVTELYNLSLSAAQAAGSAEEALKLGNVDRVDKLRQEKPELLLAKELLEDRKELGKLVAQRKEWMAWGDPRNPHDAQTRQDMIMQLDQAMTALASSKLDIYKSLLGRP